MKLSWLVLPLIILAVQPVPVHADELREGSSPDPNVLKTVSVGEVLFESFRYRVETIARSSQDINKHAAGSKFELRAGEPMSIQKSDAGTKLCAFRGDSIGFMSATYRCFFDEDGDGKLDRSAAGGLGAKVILNPPVPYKIEDSPIDGPQSFKSTLVYTGTASGDLRLSYREFSKGLARPAFTEDLSLPLGPTFPQTIAVKGTRFAISKIDGEGITYSVLPPKSE